jgi:NAD(P)-dependent dehydrogenase (short-subunit alcohol dehydrogenase family)
MGSKEEVAARQAQATPMARAGKPEEVAAAVVWLCSDGASFVTGHTMVIVRRFYDSAASEPGASRGVRLREDNDGEAAGALA